MPEEPPQAWLRQVQPGEVVGDEDEVGGEHRHLNQVGGGAVGACQDLHRVQREEEQGYGSVSKALSVNRISARARCCPEQ